MVFRQLVVAVLEGRERRGGARHYAAQQRERAPVADALLAPIKLLARAHDFRTEVVGLAKKLEVGGGEPIGLVGGIPLRETILAFPVVLDVPTGALDEVARQLDPTRLVEL